MKSVIGYLFEAYKGRMLWGRYKAQYGSGKNEHYLIFPETDSEYNTITLNYVDEFINRYTIRKMIVVSCDSAVYGFFDVYKRINIKNLMISQKQMKCLMRYAALVNRMKEWTIVSVKTPFDTGAERLLGLHGLSVEDIVCYDILKLDKKDERL